jgi:CheY-like chemotaxis protein
MLQHKGTNMIEASLPNNVAERLTSLYTLNILDMPRHERLDRIPRTAQRLYIALTANARESDRLACLAAGMDDHIAKPVDVDRLGALLEHWLGERQREER